MADSLQLPMDERQIQSVIDKVNRKSMQSPRPCHPAAAVGWGYGSISAEPVAGDLGVFATLDEAVAAAQTAFNRLNTLPLDIRQKMVSHMRQAGRENATVLAEMAHSKTGMGRVADKVLKICSTPTKHREQKRSIPVPGAVTAV